MITQSNEIFSFVLTILIILGSILSYIPQFHIIIKNKSVDNISELTLVLSNIGFLCLTLNLLILSWNDLFCPVYLSCFINILPLLTCLVSWLLLLIYYGIFIFYRIKNRNKRIISVLNYLICYFIFTIFIIALSLGEKIAENNKFFVSFSKILGICSAVMNGLVYIPQIYILLREKESGSVSIFTYLLQTPGNLFVIIYQAVIYSVPVTTYITYVISFVEQLIILCILLYYECRKVRYEEREEVDVMRNIDSYPEDIIYED